MGVYRKEKNDFDLHVFFPQHMKSSSINFYISTSIELTKILHVHFHIVRETVLPIMST